MHDALETRRDGSSTTSEVGFIFGDLLIPGGYYVHRSKNIEIVNKLFRFTTK